MGVSILLLFFRCGRVGGPPDAVSKRNCGISAIFHAFRGYIRKWVDFEWVGESVVKRHRAGAYGSARSVP